MEYLFNLNIKLNIEFVGMVKNAFIIRLCNELIFFRRLVEKSDPEAHHYRPMNTTRLLRFQEAAKKL